ncbi:hypothetical protein Tco_1274455 [Tanacetum coccineum]
MNTSQTERSLILSEYDIIKSIGMSRLMNCVIWERVYDFQLGIETYYIKINLTAPSITYPGFEKDPLYSIIDVPFVGIVYENNKEARHEIIKISLNDKDKEPMALLEEDIKKD